MTRRALLVLFMAVLVVAGLAGYYWSRPRVAEITDGVIHLAAVVSKDRVRVTATNVASDPVEVEHCTYHTRLGGGVLQPVYVPCMPKTVPVAPGQSVTDSMPIEGWVRSEAVWVTIRYALRGETGSLKLPLPHP